MSQSELTAAPAEADARRILTAVGGVAVTRIARFPQGLAHFVYDAELADGRRWVARLARRDQSAAFAGACYWRERLLPLGVPLPELHYADPSGGEFGFPALILERLPGTDLGLAYPSLSRAQKRELAVAVATIQARVGSLPHGRGFGFATRYDDPALLPSWPALLDAHVARSRGRIEAAGVVDPSCVERVQAAVDARRDYLSSVAPMPFLDDTTTKNVIVAEGRLSGIVDVDVVCFGDPLFTPALTRMALLSLGYDLDYLDAWLEELQLTPERCDALTLYTALFCLGFLAELGQRFNRDQPLPAPPERVRLLLATLDDLLAELGAARR